MERKLKRLPSRLLNYMAANLPVLACTDLNTDIGKVIVDNGFGWWCESNDVNEFEKIIHYILQTDHTALDAKRENEYSYLWNNYHVNHSYKNIENKWK